MVGKPFVICFCYLFWTWPWTTFKSIPIILNLLTNRNIALIYSVIICEQKTTDCAGSGNYSTVVFNFDVCWVFEPVSSTNCTLPGYQLGFQSLHLTSSQPGHIRISAKIAADWGLPFTGLQNGMFRWDVLSTITRIMVYQRKRRIIFQKGYSGSFNVPWFEWS